MPQPKPWSFSALDDFKNCPRAFHAKKVAKTVSEGSSPQMKFGNYVHKAFEKRVKFGAELPNDLSGHVYVDELAERAGETFAERKIALNKSLQPCAYFDQDVWWRGVIDYGNIHGGRALLVDYKTGKPHTKFEQLSMFALHTFYDRPDVHTCEVEFYWTQTEERDGLIYNRKNMAKLWEPLVPDLKQYADAFKSDIWQPRPSGLCHGWCPVEDCEHWRPKKKT